MKRDSFLEGLFEIGLGLIGLGLGVALLLPPLPPTPGFSQHRWQVVTGFAPPVSGVVEAMAVAVVVLAVYVLFCGSRRGAKTTQ